MTGKKTRRPCGECFVSYKAKSAFCIKCGRPIKQHDAEDLKQMIAESVIAENRKLPTKTTEDTTTPDPVEPAGSATDEVTMPDEKPKETKAEEPAATKSTAPSEAEPKATVDASSEAEPKVLIDEPVIELTQADRKDAKQTVADGQSAEVDENAITQKIPVAQLAGLQASSTKRGLAILIVVVAIGLMLAGLMLLVVGPLNDLTTATKTASKKATKAKTTSRTGNAKGKNGMLTPEPLIAPFADAAKKRESSTGPTAPAEPAPAIAPPPPAPTLAPVPTVQFDVSDCHGNKVEVDGNRVILKSCVRTLPAD